jgi:hypothetical protein
MPTTVTFTKLPSSDRAATGANGYRELRYLARAEGDDIDDYSVILAAAIADLPASVDGLGGRQVMVEPIDAERGLWEAAAHYRPLSRQPAEPPPVGADSELEFVVSTSSVRITQSRDTSGVYVPDGEPAPTPTGAIGLTDDGVEGCDILVPEARWSETHFFADATMTPTYRRQLLEIVGRVNDDTFRGHAAGELLLLGVRGRPRRSDAVWQVSFEFAFSSNATGLQVGEIEDIDKLGHDYLWVYYEPVVEGDRLVQRPAVVYVEKVYETADYALLGIGA